MCTAKGSEVRPGVPWVSASFAWQAWDNVRCQGVGCTPWRPLGLRLLLRGRRGTMCAIKGSDVCPGVPWVSASFAWQAWDNVRCQGVGCMPWCPLGLRLFCVAGVGQCALPRGRMYPLASLWSPPSWDNVRYQGVGCMPWCPFGLRLFCVAGVGQCALLVAFARQAWDTVLTLFLTHSFPTLTCAVFVLFLYPRLLPVLLPSALTHSLTHPLTHSLTRSLTHSLTHAPTHPPTHALTHSLTHHSLTHSLTTHSPLTAAFARLAWQAWDNVHCQGVGCTPWRPLGLRLFCVAGVRQCALPRGRMYPLASLGSPPSFAWQAWDIVRYQGVGCMPWCPLGLCLFCVAGVPQCALPRGRMCALASLGSPPLLRGRRGTMCIAKG